jgi:hypothetical protein
MKDERKIFRLADILQFARNGLSVKQFKAEDGLPITRIETISKAEINPGKVGYAGLKRDECVEWYHLIKSR